MLGNNWIIERMQFRDDEMIGEIDFGTGKGKVCSATAQGHRKNDRPFEMFRLQEMREGILS